MRCAAIVTEVGGNTETIQNNRTGIVIRPECTDDIIRSLLQLKDKQVRFKFCNEAYHYAKKKFSVTNTLGKLEKLLNK